MNKIFNLINIFSTNQKDFIFVYSEDSNYWVHLKPLVTSMLKDESLKIIYISSNKDDLGLKFKNINFKSFYLGFGAILVWFFKNINCKIMITSSPDLDNFQFKKSKNNVHYIYIQHSLNSLHSAYNHNAFNAYDTIFCSTENHIIECEKLFSKLKKKPILFKHGYDRLLTLPPKNENINSKNKIVLISPSWGPSSLLMNKEKLSSLIETLIDNNCEVILRPHHMTLRTDKNYIDNLQKKFSKFNNFLLEKGNFNADSLAKADVLITDYSGVAFEYYFKYGGLVIFIDTGGLKINNINFKNINLSAFEIINRSKVGFLVNYENINEILLTIKNKSPKIYSNPIFNLKNSDKIAAKYVKDLYQKLSS